MNSARNRAASLLFIAIFILILPTFLSACGLKEILSNNDIITANTLTGTDSTQNISVTTVEKSNVSESEKENQLVFFGNFFKFDCFC